MRGIRNKIYDNNFMLTIGITLIIFVSVIGCVNLAQANEMKNYEKSFISIEIDDGDTLTSIAREYAKSEAEYEDYIEEVKNINNLKNDTIHDGCYLLVPVYQLVQ